MRVYIRLLILLLAINILSDENGKKLEFNINILPEGASTIPDLKCLEVTAYFTATGGRGTMRLGGLKIIEAEEPSQEVQQFTNKVHEILMLHVDFTIKNKKAQIRKLTFKDDETEWSKGLKKAILKLVSFKPTEDGLSVKIEIKEGLQDFPKLKPIPGYIPPRINVGNPKESGRPKRTCKQPHYGEKSFIEEKEDVLMVRQYRSESDPLLPLEKPAQSPHGPTQLKCRSTLKEFARKVDSKNPPKMDFSDLNELSNTYNNLQHQTSLSYVYLLMLESQVKEFIRDITKPITFEEFLIAIRYIGKGTDKRVLMHLRDANYEHLMGEVVSDQQPTQSSQDTTEDDDEKDGSDLNKSVKIDNEVVKSNHEHEKIRAIKNEWNNGFGIICYKIVDLIHPAEAHTIEALLIQAYGNTKHGGSLTNKVRGTYFTHYPEVSSWFEDERGKKADLIGSHILYRAYKAFLQQRHRPIYEKDIEALRI